MILDAGIATIYAGRNTAKKGEKPNIVYDREYCRSYYGNRTVGLNRFYRAKEFDERADILIRVDRNGGITTNHKCKLEPFESLDATGTYKIIMVQQVTDEDGLPATDLTLERIEGIEEH